MNSQDLKIDHCDVTLSETETGKRIQISAPVGISIWGSIIYEAIKERDKWNWSKK